MCEVLDRAIAKGRAEGFQKGRAEGFQKGRTEGWRSGQAEGRLEGETEMSCLLGKLLKDGRIDDIRRIAEDAEYRRKLLEEQR